MDKKKKNVFWVLIAIGVIILFLLMLASSILNIGDRLRTILIYNIPVFEYLFYLLCALLLWFLIINPILTITLSPSLSIATTLEKDSLKARKIYKSVSKNLLKNPAILNEEEINALENFENYAELKEALNTVMSGSIKKEINRIIVKNAKTVLLSTAISQNSKLDLYSVVSVNLKMVKEIVVACGFRPNMKNLSKLTLNVASTALIAEGLESLKMEDVLPTQTIAALSSVPLLKPILSSVVQGIANALLTIRIGLVARGYLFTDAKNATKNSIRAEAFKDALILLPTVIGELLVFFPSKVVKLFTSKHETATEE